MAEIYGYCRVSTQEQNLDRQLDQLKAFGIAKGNIKKEKMSGTKRERPQLNELLNELEEGDLVVVCDITRISRSTKDLLSIIDKIKEKKANIKSLKDTWLDTTSENPYNSFLLTVMAGLSQLERDLIAERTREGLKSARARGRVGGRPKAKQEDIDRALMLYDMQKLPIADICSMCKISKNTLYNYIRERKENQSKKE